MRAAHSAIGILAVLAVATASTTSLRAQPGGQKKPPLAVVRVAPVGQQSVEVSKTFVGTVMPTRKSILGSAVDGRVAEFLVNEGDAVIKGQPVAQLLTKTIEAEVAAADAQWDLRKHELAEMKNGTRKEDLDAVVAREAAAKAIAEYAANKLRRLESLAKRGQATDDELEDAISQANQLNKLYVAARAARELAEAGPRVEQIAQAKAREATAGHEVDRLRDMQSKYAIRAPFDGYVSAEHTEIGAWVNKGEPIVEVVELKQVDVMAMVPEADVANLALGMEAAVQVDALPNEKFAGKVQSIVPQADVRSRSFPVKIRVDNQEIGGQPLLKAGMFARVSLRVTKPSLALVVPKDALVLNGADATVYVVERDGQRDTVRPIPVALGESVGSSIAVTPKKATDTLKIGQLVVTEGNERRRPGEEVRILAQHEK